MRRWNRLIAAVLITISWVAEAQVPMTGQLIELQGLINARQEGANGQVDFRKDTKNRLYILDKGSRGQITAVKKMESGNYGIKVRLINVQGVQEEVWVYYQYDKNDPNKKDSNITLLNATTNNSQKQLEVWQEEAKAGRDAVKVAHKYNEVLDPAKATHIQTKTKVQALGANTHGMTTDQVTVAAAKAAMDAATKAAMDSPANIDQDAMNRMSLAKINDANQAKKSIGNPSNKVTDCIDGSCKAKPLMVSDIACTEKNNYIENLLQNKSSLPVVQLLTQQEPKSVKLMSCIESEMARVKGVYVDCDRKSQVAISTVKACSSLNYKKMVTNAFELVNECLVPYATNSQDEAVNNNMKSLYYSMISAESGFQVNVRRAGGGDSGLLQFVQDGIRTVNKNGSKNNYFTAAMDSLAGNTNPTCQNLANLNLSEMSDKIQQRCDATSIEKGNPVLSLIYGLGLLKANREAFQRELQVSSPVARSNWNKLSPQTQSLLLNYTATWAHNYPADRSAVINTLAINQKFKILQDGKPSDVERFLESVQGTQKKGYIRSIVGRKNNKGDVCVN